MPNKLRRRQRRRVSKYRLGRWPRRSACLLGAGLLLLAAGRPASALTPAVPDYGRTPAPGATTAGPGAPARLPDPIEVEPNWHDLPGKDKILNLLDVASQVGLACCIAAFVVGGGIMGLSKLAGASRGGPVASAMVLGGGGGAILIVVAPEAVAWLAS